MTHTGATKGEPRTFINKGSRSNRNQAPRKEKMSIVKMEKILATLYDQIGWETVAPGEVASICYPAFERILIRENILSTDRTAKLKWKILYTSKLAVDYAPKQQRIYLDIERVRAFLTKTGQGFIPYERTKTEECVRECVCENATEAKE